MQININIRPLMEAEQSMPHLNRTGSLLEAGQEQCHFTQLTARLDKGPYYVNSPLGSPCCGGWEKVNMLCGTTTLPCGGEGGDAKI